MVYQSPISENRSRPLLGAREGMAVYDWDDKKVGIVRCVQFPNESDYIELDASTPYLASLDEFPPNIQARLLREGFIFVEGGFFTPDRYIMPDQILEVNDQDVILNVLKSELVQI
jgi:hypothetical protein